MFKSAFILYIFLFQLQCQANHHEIINRISTIKIQDKRIAYFSEYASNNKVITTILGPKSSPISIDYLENEICNKIEFVRLSALGSKENNLSFENKSKDYTQFYIIQKGKFTTNDGQKINPLDIFQLPYLKKITITNHSTEECHFFIFYLKTSSDIQEVRPNTPKKKNKIFLNLFKTKSKNKNVILKTNNLIEISYIHEHERHKYRHYDLTAENMQEILIPIIGEFKFHWISNMKNIDHRVFNEKDIIIINSWSKRAFSPTMNGQGVLLSIKTKNL